MYKNSRTHKIPDGGGRSQSYRDYLNGQQWTYSEYYELFGRRGRPDINTAPTVRRIPTSTYELKSDDTLRKKYRDLLRNKDMGGRSGMPDGKR